MATGPRAVLLAILLFAPRVVAADCSPVTPVACPKCFAVFVMPDTQNYTTLANQPAAANHLDLVTRYICQQRAAWTEPSTGKQMPISMVIHLGDIVQSGDLEEAVAGPLAEWQRASAAFDNLDSCDPVVPYLVTNGNHDQDRTGCELYDTTGCYENPTEGYETYFGADRWESQGYGCAAPDDCDWQAGEWFLGSGDEIAAGSRNNVGEGSPGPQVAQQGRHRAGLIRSPSGMRLLFLGLEMALDFPPAAAGFEGVEGDDTQWVKQLLEFYPDVPTVAFHHSMFWAFEPPDTRVRWGPETWHSDSIRDIPVEEPPEWGTVRGMKDLFDHLLAPYPQVRFIFTGHVLVPTTQADYTIPRDGAPPVWGMLRNYQQVDLGLSGGEDNYGVGWNVIAVFDPDAEQVRIRSYRIDDEEAYTDPPVNYLHAGEPAPTECFETDQNGFPERIISWDFAPARAQMPSLSVVGVAVLAALVLSTALWALGRQMRRRSA